MDVGVLVEQRKESVAIAAARRCRSRDWGITRPTEVRPLEKGMIQAQAPRGWMQIQMSPSRSPGGRSSPSTQVKSATRGGISERFSSPSKRGRTRPYPLQSRTKRACSWSRRSASRSRTLSET